MMTDSPDLAALIGSRICHDLVSPIGAIGNGVELMLMDTATPAPELALISDSVAHANGRIRYFRLAFGAAGEDQRIARTEVQAILAEVTRGGRLRIDWHSDPDLARADVKLAFLLIQCLETAMPWGGKLAVDQGAARWTITADAPRFRIDAALWEGLSAPRPPTGITPALVHFALVPEELRRRLRRFSAELGETAIRLGF